MPQYVLNRDYTLRSTMGHTVEFRKGEPVYVPPLIEREVIAIGGECADGDGADPLEGVGNQPAEMSFEELTMKMEAAFKVIVERNDAKEFTGQGVPTVKAVERIIGVDIDRADLMSAWAEFKAKG
jgi:hypothetical protein